MDFGERRDGSDGDRRRSGVYEERGDYHRVLDCNWPYAPTYLRKMLHVREWLDRLPVDARVLDAGCGEGVLVEEYRSRGRGIEGIDLHYESKFVRRGDILQMPYESETFDAVLLLDVLEHLAFGDQPLALAEVHRVLKKRGLLFVSIPNLAHLNSRVRFLLKGKLDRVSDVMYHPGERPIVESVRLLFDAGFKIQERRAVTLTLPWVYRNLICRFPAKFRRLHDFLDRFALPSLAMLVLYVCLRDE